MKKLLILFILFTLSACATSPAGRSQMMGYYLDASTRPVYQLH